MAVTSESSNNRSSETGMSEEAKLSKLTNKRRQGHKNTQAQRQAQAEARATQTVVQAQAGVNTAEAPAKEKQENKAAQ